METEDFRIWVEGQASRVLHIAFRIAVDWRVVCARWRELIVILEDPLIEVVFEKDLNEDSVVTISNSTTVVALGCQVS